MDVTFKQGFHDRFLLILQCFHRFFISEITCNDDYIIIVIVINRIRDAVAPLVEVCLSSHLSVTEAKQQRHAKALARGDDRGRDLVHGLPRRAGLRSERRHDVLETEQRYEDERGPHRFAGPARRRGHLVVAVHAAVVPLET